MQPAAAGRSILDEDLEDGALDNWTVVDENGSEYGEYYPAVTTCRADNSSRSVWLVGGGTDGSALGCGAHYPDHGIPWMMYGPFSTVGETAMRLNFSHWTYIEPAVPFYIFDRFCVWASENNEHYIGYCFTGDWGGWFDYSFNLKDDDPGFYDFLNKPQVWVAFSMMTDSYVNFPEGAYVDNISLQRCTGASTTAGCSGSTTAGNPMRTGFQFSDLLNPFFLPSLQSQPLIIGPLFYDR